MIWFSCEIIPPPAVTRSSHPSRSKSNQPTPPPSDSRSVQWFCSSPFRYVATTPNSLERSTNAMLSLTSVIASLARESSAEVTMGSRSRRQAQRSIATTSPLCRSHSRARSRPSQLFILFMYEACSREAFYCVICCSLIHDRCSDARSIFPRRS